MSEYQYYEFQAIDRRLDAMEMRELRACSSRAQITPTCFVNEYSFGSFKGNADAWMEKYFDAYLYLANWGTHELQLRVPSSLLPMKTAELYCPDRCASVREKSGNLILTFISEEEGGGEWVEGGGLLSSLIAVRDDLMRGDLRALYLGWLLSVQSGELDDGSLEPPVPANLRNLTPSLSSLADFLRIDLDLIEVAAEASPGHNLESPDRAAMVAWVASLTAAEKDDVFVRVKEGGAADVARELCSRFNRQTAVSAVEQPRRTVGHLLAAAATHAENRRLEQNRQAALEKAERERQAALAREKHLHSIAGRVPEIWRQIEELIATKQSKSYDLAVQHLSDLRELAKRGGNETAFAKRVAALREKQSRKPSFLARLSEKGM
jgi:hypothetical protein